ncbi:MAG: DUF2442 domain-containing protein [Nitrospinae bacterium]|nr:DUF2442 domain-containing protein [Nitrospinota bacterium]
MYRVIKVSVLSGYRLYVEFEDGVKGVISLDNDLFGPVFEPLKDPQYFAKAAIDEFGVICWPNGADLAPDAIYDDLKSGKSVA